MAEPKVWTEFEWLKEKMIKPLIKENEDLKLEMIELKDKITTLEKTVDKISIK